MPRLGHEQELASLGRALRRQVVGARAVLLVADALDMSPGDLLGHTARHLQLALRKISVGKLGEVAQAMSSNGARRPQRANPVKGLSFDAIARFVLDRNEPGSKLELVERAIVDYAMKACSGNQSAAARLLGIERKALARRLAKARPRKPRR